MTVDLIRMFDLFGVAVFAVSGALVAGRKQMDLFGVIVLAIVTGIGGGTLRDLLLGSTPVFWIDQPVYIVVASGAALGTLATRRVIPLRRTVLLVADAIGLAFFCVLGAAKAVQAGAGPTIPMLMGVMTGVVGGVIRDLLAGEVPLILRHDLYATVAVVGAGSYELLTALGTSEPVAAWIGMLSALGLRLAAIRWHWGLPMFSFGNENPEN
jgi:uncharacterized membrane protein YeiH